MMRTPDLGIRDNIVLLRSLAAFAAMDDEALVVLAEHARIRRVRAGERLLDLEAPIDRVFVVLEGKIRWSRRGRPEVVAERHQVVGWIALMAREESLSAIADVDAVVLELPAETVERALEDYFPIVRNTLRLGAASLVRARGHLPVARAGAPAAEMGDRDAPRTVVERVMAMRTAAIFGRASVEAVLALARSWAEVRAAPGDVLWRAGEDASFWLFVDYGRIACTTPAGERVEVGTAFVLGIMDAIGGLPRSYEARAVTEVVASRIELEGFLGVLETHFDLARDFIADLARAALDGT